MAQTKNRITAWEEQLLSELPRALACSSRDLNLRCYEELESTMTLFEDSLYPSSIEQLSLQMARLQTAGRGRQGRVWHSPARGFMGTFWLRVATDSTALASLPLVVCCAVLDVCVELGAAVRVKWPNDIQDLSGQKLCGILTELQAVDDGVQIAVGIGLNISGVPAEAPGVSLVDLIEREISEVQLAILLAPVLRRYISDYCEHGFSCFRERWQSAAAQLGSAMLVRSGSEFLEGSYEGLSDEGYLLLRVGHEQRVITAGEVSGVVGN